MARPPEERWPVPPFSRWTPHPKSSRAPGTATRPWCWNSNRSMPRVRGTNPRATRRRRNCARRRPTATRSSCPGSKSRSLLNDRDRLPRALTHSLAHVVLDLRGDLFLVDGQHVVVAQLKDVRVDAHAHAVALAESPIDFDL